MKIIGAIMSISSLIDDLGSFVMKSILRLNGASIGKNTYISFSSRIVGTKSLSIGNDCIIKSNVKIKCQDIVIGENCIISENCYITGDKKFEIGNKTFIGKKVRINVSMNVLIGEDVGVGENSVIWTHGYFPPADEGYPISYAPVEIKDGAWVSTNIIILPGVTIGKGVIIGAGSVVTKNVDDDSLIAGNPAKFIKNTSEFRSKKAFIDIMANIFSKYPTFELSEKKDNLLKYKFEKKYLFILDGSKEHFEPADFPKNSLIIFKNMPNATDFKINTFLWFDLIDREMTCQKSKEIAMIVNILRSYGIRLIKNYSIK